MAAAPDNRSDPMSFGEHLDALRPHLLRSAGVVVLLLVVAFGCRTWLIDGLLFGPLRPDFPLNRLLAALGAYAPPELTLVNTTVAGQFNLHLSISFAAACVLGFPYLLGELWRFVRPALTPGEQRVCRRCAGYVAAGFFAGLLFGYFVLAPLSIAFLTNSEASAAIANLIDVRSYLATVLNVTIACAVVFQLPLLVWLLTRMGLLTPQLLLRYRRHALVALAVLSAVITPPDLCSMVLLLLPLYGLYELSIGIARRVYRSGESGSRDITQ